MVRHDCFKMIMAHQERLKPGVQIDEINLRAKPPGA